MNTATLEPPVAESLPPPVAPPPAPRPPFDGYTGEHRLTISQLIATQQQLAMNNTDFCNGSDVDPTTWGRLREGKYYTRQGPGTLLARLQRHLKNLMQRKQMQQQRNELGLDTGDYIKFADYDAIREAVNATLVTSERGGENKLVIYSAPSGYGKTRSGLQLMREGFMGRMVTARPSWTSSYFPALQAIARELDLNDEFRSTYQAEREILNTMGRKDRGVLIINEFDLVCRALADFMRSILNETSWCILILITPEGYRRLLQRGGSGIEQLMRRCEAHIAASHISGPQVQEFFKRHWAITDGLKVAAKDIADEANRFGGFDCVVSVIDLLVTEFGESAPTLEQVRAKVRVYRESKPLTLSAERRAAK